MRWPSDERLVQRVRRGRGGAFAAIYDRHHRGVLTLCAHVLGDRAAAHDVLRRTFADTLKAIRGGREPIALAATLYAIAHDHCAEVLERRPAAAASGPLAALPTDERLALALAEVDMLGRGELVDVLGVTPHEAAARVARARVTLAGSSGSRKPALGRVAPDRRVRAAILDQTVGARSLGAYRWGRVRTMAAVAGATVAVAAAYAAVAQVQVEREPAQAASAVVAGTARVPAAPAAARLAAPAVLRASPQPTRGRVLRRAAAVHRKSIARRAVAPARAAPPASRRAIAPVRRGARQGHGGPRPATHLTPGAPPPPVRRAPAPAPAPASTVAATSSPAPAPAPAADPGPAAPPRAPVPPADPRPAPPPTRPAPQPTPQPPGGNPGGGRQPGQDGGQQPGGDHGRGGEHRDHGDDG